MIEFEKLLSGGDLRSTGKGDAVISKIKNQQDFDNLFKFLFHHNRIVVMHAADTIEKITIKDPQYLPKHKTELIELFYMAKNKELKWHLAVLVPRLNLNKIEFGKIWDAMTNWAIDKTNSRLVRVGAVQGLFEMVKQQSGLIKDFTLTMFELEKENIPSINARIRNIRKQLNRTL